jgi:uncharacterized Tic20 family protein
MTTSSDLERELEQMAERELSGDRRALSAPVGVPRNRLDAEDARFPQEDKNVAVGVHLSTMISMLMSAGTLTWAIPLIAHFLVGTRSEALQQHVRAQLNFQITMLLVVIAGIGVGVVTLGVGFFVTVPIMLMYALVSIWGSIRAAIAANNGEAYEYPLTHEFLK